jgi:hypothetical protein
MLHPDVTKPIKSFRTGSNNNYLPPIILYQDNQSTILLATNGRSTSGRTRHVDIRFFWIKDRVENGEVTISYLPTDVLTKHMNFSNFASLASKLLGEY